MICLGKNRWLKGYNIDVNGVITDDNGVIQKTWFSCDREYFKKIGIHRIMMYTYKGYQNLDIHHIDGNKHNNKLENLVYLTHSEHTSLHQKNKQHMLGKHHTEESKQKISDARKGIKFSDEHKQKLSDSLKGKHRSEETKRKISESRKAYYANKNK